MMQSLWIASPPQVPILRVGFTILRDNAIIELWVAAVVAFLGMLYAPRQDNNEEIRDSLYLLFLLIATIGTILALFFT